MRKKLIGRVLARDVVDEETGELLFAEDHVLTNDDLDTFIEYKIPKLSLRGSQMDINDDLNHTNKIENVMLGAPEDSIRDALREAMVENMLGRRWNVRFMIPWVRKFARPARLLRKKRLNVFF